MAPFTFNLASVGVVPIGAFVVKTAEAQVDIIYDAADDPATPKDHATQLASLAGKMMKKICK